jgi:hypothetical protein
MNLLHALFPHRDCLFFHQFYPLLEHEYSEQWYETKEPLVLCTISVTSKPKDLCLFHRKMYIRLLVSVLSLSHLIYSTATKTNLCFNSSFATLMSQSTLYVCLNSHVPYLMPHFLILGRLPKKEICVSPRNYLPFCKRRNS